ncbi:hypothetical protein [Microbacterium sp. LWH12-1.2]|uniref:hypothetical protein n=1 Tax=Microbacterium sp. LWH12-1.2 TaxID=3135259 RepID=UPI00341A5ABE
MADRETDGGDRTLVTGAHRVIRTLDAQEGPYPGALVTHGDGVAVQADAASLSGWDGWAYAGAEHVAGPVDMVRRVDGQDVLLPWCSERLAAFLGRRAAAGVAVSAGETATLVGSLLRGLDELGGGATVGGSWWLTDEGRPVFVLGDGESARESAARIVGRLQESTTDRALGRTLTTVQQGLVQPRVPRRVQDDWERELFENAAPKPLRREVFPPERARDIAPQHAALDDFSEPVHGHGPAVFVEGLRSRILERWRMLVAERPQKDRGRRSTVSEGAPRRRRTLVVAGAAAAAVLAIGLLWPTGGSDEAGAQTDGASEAATRAQDDAVPPAESSTPSSETHEPTDETDAAPTAETSDPLYAATALLAVIRACAEAEDGTCGAAVADGAAGVVERLGAVAQDRELALVDEYGDVAVIRLTPTASTSEPGGADEEEKPMSELMIVLVRLNQNWLVRDVYDVADQPG